METENNQSSSNGNVEKMSIPPGFVSLSSFTLTRLHTKEAPCTSAELGHESHAEPNLIGSIVNNIDVEKFKSNLWRRPWILDSFLCDNPKEPDSELEMNLLLKACLPRGVVRGCASCPNCQKVISHWRPEEPHRPVLEEAPVFHPTEEEFKETLKYVASIRQKAEHIGMCRIVPPPSWKPPFLPRENNDWENLKFETTVQLVNELQDQILKTTKLRVQKEVKRKRQKVLVRSSKDGCPDDPKPQCLDESCISNSGPKLTLDAFEKYADDFKRQYFCEKDKAKSSNSKLGEEGWEPSIEDVEGEYWRIVENPSEEIEVLHGSKFESGASTTGFPVNHISTETPQYSPEYLESGWNLNNTFKLHGSLLCYENDGTSSSLLPQFSAGMCFSSACWKVEEHLLYSLSYLHLGGPKIWYVVPGRYCYKFEKVVKKHIPQSSERPELLYRIIPQLSTSTLIAEDIPVYRCVQYPREFVLIFPAAYNSYFNCDFSCSEAVNVAPFDWLPFGQHVTEIYSDQGRRPSISQDKLLLRAAGEAVKAQWQLLLLKIKLLDNEIPWTTVCGKNGILTKALKVRVKYEVLSREYLCKSLQSQKMENNFDLLAKRECTICLSDLQFSAVSCSCSPSRYACPKHAKELCSCPWTSRCLLIRNEIDELNILVEAVEGKLDAVYKWGKQKLGLSMNSSKLKDAIPIPNTGAVSAYLKSAASSPISSALGSLFGKKREDPVNGQVTSNKRERKNSVCDPNDIILIDNEDE